MQNDALIFDECTSDFEKPHAVYIKICVEPDGYL